MTHTSMAKKSYYPTGWRTFYILSLFLKRLSIVDHYRGRVLCLQGYLWGVYLTLLKQQTSNDKAAWLIITDVSALIFQD